VTAPRLRAALTWGSLSVVAPELDHRRVVILAPMPLEMNAIVTAFGLSPSGEADDAPWTGRVGGSDVTAIHVGMGPPLTRAAATRVLDEAAFASAPVDHLMIAGICGGLDRDLPVGTLLNPEMLVDHASGATYRHLPPGSKRAAGKIVTTEGVHLDPALSERFRVDGCLGVDMESATVAEVCEPRGCAWSVYRCIGDRYFDGLLDERVLALTNPDGSGNMAELERLLATEPDLAANLDQLSRDTTLAAHLAAEAAVEGCLALDG
jgi:nucleoside phosphorylase